MTDYGRARIWDNDNSKWLDLVGNPVGGVVEGIVFDGDLHVTGDIYSGAVGNEGDELHVGPLDGDLDGYIDDKLALYLPLAGGTMTGAILGFAGTAGAPGYAFDGDADTGMYSWGANAIGWSLGGVLKLTLAGGDLYIGSDGNVLGAGYIKGSSGGTQAAPTYAFQQDYDTGMYRSAADALGFAAGGSQIMRVRATGPYISSTNGGDAANPAFGFVDDGDTGMYLRTTNQWALAAGGVECIFGTNDAFFSPVSYANTVGTAANVNVGTDGNMRRSTSARKYKTDIRKLATKQRPEFVERELPAPVEFKHKGDGKKYLGFIADELAEHDERLGEYGADGEVENYDLRGVVAILAAKMNRLEGLVL